MNPAGGMMAHLMTDVPSELNLLASLEALGNAALLGVLLMLLTAWVSSMTSKTSSTTTETTLTPSDLVINSANVLFICFGMTGMMLLVNNNIARAFAIAAAIALVRFKIKVDSKIMSMSMFYGVLTGMACGVGHPYIGYALVMFFGILQLFVVFAVRFARKRFPAPPATTSILTDASAMTAQPIVAVANPNLIYPQT